MVFSGMKIIPQYVRQSTRWVSSSSSSVEEWIYSLPRRFLRDWEFDEYTHQRTNVAFNSHDGRLMPKESDYSLEISTITSINADNIHVHWKDGHITKYSKSKLQQHLDAINYNNENNKTSGQEIIPWKGWEENDVTRLKYDDVVEDENSKLELLKTLYQYGIVCVTSTPCTDQGISKLVHSVLGGTIMNTLYGQIWSTTSVSNNTNSEADSAYGCGALPLHTDMTYYQNPPGLQIFTMKTPAAKGGASIFADGYALVQDLPIEARDILSTTIRHYQSIDDPTWHLQASGPIIEYFQNDNSHQQRIRCIRHNDLDRLPDLPTSFNDEGEENFYRKLQQAHDCWDELLAKDEYRLVMPLQSGDTIIVANQVRYF